MSSYIKGRTMFWERGIRCPCCEEHFSLGIFVPNNMYLTPELYLSPDMTQEEYIEYLDERSNGECEIIRYNGKVQEGNT